MTGPNRSEHELATPIATRELESDFGPITVTMGAPRPTEDGQDFLCVTKSAARARRSAATPWGSTHFRRWN